ncbi:MAG: HNH endonuclease [Pelagimonas sp.]|jgi:5-methylcytosine-specific restriction endonuclease McrA|nr:HNH endonuclease [Pelagimonas sp.]
MASKSDREHVWNKAKTVRGKNPNLFRRDSQGNEIYKPAYGRNSPKGWEVDHIKPKSKGGSDAKRNLQALQTSANRKKSDKLPRKSSR